MINIQNSKDSSDCWAKLYKTGKLEDAKEFEIKDGLHNHIYLVGQVFDGYGSNGSKNKIISRAAYTVL